MSHLAQGTGHLFKIFPRRRPAKAETDVNRAEVSRIVGEVRQRLERVMQGL